jgi:putative transposase
MTQHLRTPGIEASAGHRARASSNPNSNPINCEQRPMSSHHPPHIHLDNTWYMTTAVTFHHQALLASEEAKQYLRDTLQTSVQTYGISLRAWVILDNHYHLLLRTKRGQDLPRFFGQLHGSTARRINLHDATPGRQVWQNYWDTCLRTEADLWTRFNYIHINPVKHGYVQQPEDWPFSSYRYFLRAKGEHWLSDCWARYPVADFLEGDVFGRGTG